MSFEPLPPNIERDVSQFALEQHISHDEAVLKLIEKGLGVGSKRRTDLEESLGKKSGELLIGLFSEPDDLAIFDDALTYSKELRETARR